MGIAHFYTSFIRPVLRFCFNKYMFVLLLAASYMLFFGDSTLFYRMELKDQIQGLNQEIETYTQKGEDCKRKINELNSSKANLEKFVREEYGMKKPNEDIFIIKRVAHE